MARDAQGLRIRFSSFRSRNAHPPCEVGAGKWAQSREPLLTGGGGGLGKRGSSPTAQKCIFLQPKSQKPRNKKCQNHPAHIVAARPM